MSRASGLDRLSELLPGQIGFEKSVIDPEVCKIIGSELLRIIKTNMSEDELSDMVSTPIYDLDLLTSNDWALPYLEPIDDQLGHVMPNSSGEISVRRLRYQVKNRYSSIHTDAATDYRLVIPLLGIGELKIYDPMNIDEPLGTQEFEPGDIMVVNNNIADVAKVPHSVRSISDERLAFVFGREL